MKVNFCCPIWLFKVMLGLSNTIVFYYKQSWSEDICLSMSATRLLIQRPFFSPWTTVVAAPWSPLLLVSLTHTDFHTRDRGTYPVNLAETLPSSKPSMASHLLQDGVPTCCYGFASAPRPCPAQLPRGIPPFPAQCPKPGYSFHSVLPAHITQFLAQVCCSYHLFHLEQ